MSQKPAVAARLPEITLQTVGGGPVTLGKPTDAVAWQMVVVYRGKHCPICHRYLGTLEKLKSRFADNGVEVLAVSGDPAGKAKAMVDEVGLTMPVGYDLSVDQMNDLGLYISDPRSPEETDRPFAEPGVLVINGEGLSQVVDISNVPFSRPDLEGLASGLEFIRNKDYPIRGTRV